MPIERYPIEYIEIQRDQIPPFAEAIFTSVGTRAATDLDVFESGKISERLQAHFYGAFEQKEKLRALFGLLVAHWQQLSPNVQNKLAITICENLFKDTSAFYQKSFLASQYLFSTPLRAHGIYFLNQIIEWLSGEGLAKNFLNKFLEVLYDPPQNEQCIELFIALFHETDSESIKAFYKTYFDLFKVTSPDEDIQMISKCISKRVMLGNHSSGPEKKAEEALISSMNGYIDKVSMYSLRVQRKLFDLRKRWRLKWAGPLNIFYEGNLLHILFYLLPEYSSTKSKVLSMLKKFDKAEQTEIIFQAKLSRFSPVFIDIVDGLDLASQFKLWSAANRSNGSTVFRDTMECYDTPTQSHLLDILKRFSPEEQVKLLTLHPNHTKNYPNLLYTLVSYGRAQNQDIIIQLLQLVRHWPQRSIERILNSNGGFIPSIVRKVILNDKKSLLPGLMDLLHHLSPKEQRTFIKQEHTDFSENTLMLLLSHYKEGVPMVVEALAHQPRKFVSDLFDDLDSEGNDMLKMAARQAPEYLPDLLTLLMSLEPNKIDKVLHSKNSNGETLLMRVAETNLESLDRFLRLLEAYDLRDLNKCLQVTDFSRRSALMHMVMHSENEQMASNFLQFVKDRLPQAALVDLFLMRDTDGYTVIQYALSQGNLAMLEVLLHTVSELHPRFQMDILFHSGFSDAKHRPEAMDTFDGGEIFAKGAELLTEAQKCMLGHLTSYAKRDLVLEIIKQNPKLLNELESIFLDDFDIVANAVCQIPELIYYASDRLQASQILVDIAEMPTQESRMTRLNDARDEKEYAHEMLRIQQNMASLAIKGKLKFFPEQAQESREVSQDLPRIAATAS